MFRIRGFKILIHSIDVRVGSEALAVTTYILHHMLIVLRYVVRWLLFLNLNFPVLLDLLLSALIRDQALRDVVVATNVIY